MPVQIPADADLNTLRTPGFYWCDGATNANRPDDSGSFCLIKEKTGSWAGNGVKQTFTNYDSGAIYTRVSPKDIWKPWRLLATATPPQEFDLPLAEGLEPIEPCRYSKDQFGRVLVNIDCTPTTGSVSIGENQSLSIGTLPEGFRPAHYTSNACEVIVGQSRYIGTFDINEYGTITLWTDAPSASIIIGSVLFDTA